MYPCRTYLCIIFTTLKGWCLSKLRFYDKETITEKAISDLVLNAFNKTLIHEENVSLTLQATFIYLYGCLNIFLSEILTNIKVPEREARAFVLWNQGTKKRQTEAKILLHILYILFFFEFRHKSITILYNRKYNIILVITFSNNTQTLKI